MCLAMQIFTVNKVEGVYACAFELNVQKRERAKERGREREKERKKEMQRIRHGLRL